MDTVDGILVLGFIILIIWGIKDIKNLIIPTKKRMLEIIVVLIGVVVFLVIALLYAKTWIHYIAFILGVTLLVLMVARVGIASKGFNSMKGMIGINWDKVSSAEVSFKNDDVKVEIFANLLRWDYQYYKKEDYDRIIAILHEKLSGERVRIK